MSDQPSIMIPDMCQKHQSLLVRQANFGPKDPWRALVVMSNVALFQGASCDQKIHAELGGDITKFAQLGCLACRKPDLFGEVVEAAKYDMSDIKALGEKWVAAAKEKDNG